MTLLTGGGDRPYAFGLATELISKGAALDVIGSDDLDCPEFHGKPGLNFLNLRGDQRPDVGFVRKMSQGIRSTMPRLIRYAATAKPRIFHILWNNKFEAFDRTLLMLYYRLLGKKIVLTVHNVNAARRDSKDTILNRLTLASPISACRPYLRSHGTDEARTRPGVRRASGPGHCYPVRDQQCCSEHASHSKLRQGSDWASEIVKGRFCFSAISHLIRGSNTLLPHFTRSLPA